MVPVDDSTAGWDASTDSDPPVKSKAVPIGPETHVGPAVSVPWFARPDQSFSVSPVRPRLGSHRPARPSHAHGASDSEAPRAKPDL